MPQINLKEFVLNIGNKDEVYLPNMLVRLPPRTFRGSLVKKVVIHSHLTHIGERAFHGCPELREIILPDTLEVIERGAFANDINLAEIHLPDTVTEIGDCAFVNCALKEITLPKNLKVLGFNVFRGCRSLKRAVLPDSIKEIKLSQKLFENCDSLTEISVCADCVIESGALPENCRVIYRKDAKAIAKELSPDTLIEDVIARCDSVEDFERITAEYIKLQDEKRNKK